MDTQAPCPPGPSTAGPQGLASDRRRVPQAPQIAFLVALESGRRQPVQRPTTSSDTDEEMQLVNKERQRKIRNELLTTIPPRGTDERETYAFLFFVFWCHRC